MKTVLTLALALSGFLDCCFPQQSSTWDKWEWLLGEWIGNGISFYMD